MFILINNAACVARGMSCSKLFTDRWGGAGKPSLSGGAGASEVEVRMVGI